MNGSAKIRHGDRAGVIKISVGEKGEVVARMPDGSEQCVAEPRSGWGGYYMDVRGIPGLFGDFPRQRGGPEGVAKALVDLLTRKNALAELA